MIREMVYMKPRVSKLEVFKERHFRRNPNPKLVASFVGRPPWTPVRALGILYEESQSLTQWSLDSLQACRSTASHTKMRVLTLCLEYEMISLVVSKLEERNEHLSDSKVFTLKDGSNGKTKPFIKCSGCYSAEVK